MAVVLQGFLGPFTGKVGGAVGGIWKGINYIKGYVVPANPNTPAQQTQRFKFSTIQGIAAQLLGSVVSTFWNPFAVKMSGYNYFIQQNISKVSTEGLLSTDFYATKGGLEKPDLTGAVYTSGTGALVLSWDSSVNGNGLPADNMAVLLINNTTNQVVFFDNEIGTRQTGTATVTLPHGLDNEEHIVAIWAYRGTGSTFIVSDSDNALGTNA